MPKPKLVKLSAQVTPEYLRAIKAYCAKDGRSIREVVTLAVERYLRTKGVELPDAYEGSEQA